MEPEIKDKDLILLDQSDQTMRPGLIYALALDNTLLIRRIDIHAQSVTLICDNQAFPPFQLSPEETQRLRVLARVTGTVRLWQLPAESGQPLSRPVYITAQDTFHP
jgi:phage repressor protein C with HTH and peptisase S24 domain